MSPRCIRTNYRGVQHPAELVADTAASCTTYGLGACQGPTAEHPQSRQRRVPAPLQPRHCLRAPHMLPSRCPPSPWPPSLLLWLPGHRCGAGPPKPRRTVPEPPFWAGRLASPRHVRLCVNGSFPFTRRPHGKTTSYSSLRGSKWSPSSSALWGTGELLPALLFGVAWGVSASSPFGGGMEGVCVCP